MNNHIDPDAFRCFLGSFDDVVALIFKNGVGAMSAKLDLADAFKHILVRSQDWPLLGSSWDLQLPDGSMVYLYYMDLFLPFGLCSFPALFNKYTNALQYTMQVNQVGDLLHYLDDYITVGPSDSSVCVNTIMTMITMCEECGFTVNPEMVTKPSIAKNFLGIDIYSVAMKASIDPTCLSETTSPLEAISGL